MATRKRGPVLFVGLVAGFSTLVFGCQGNLGALLDLGALKGAVQDGSNAPADLASGQVPQCGPTPNWTMGPTASPTPSMSPAPTPSPSSFASPSPSPTGSNPSPAPSGLSASPAVMSLTARYRVMFGGSGGSGGGGITIGLPTSTASYRPCYGSGNSITL